VTGAPFKDVFGAAGEDKNADDKEDGHQCPEKGHEDNSASVFENTN
jgi:hypothetical protein